MKKSATHSPDSPEEPLRPARAAKPLHRAIKALLTVYFLICFLFLGVRWFVNSHVDDYRDDLTTIISKAAGIELKSSKFSVGFYYLWPTFTLEDVEISRPGGPVSLTLPAVQGQLSWSSLWHWEPRFRHFTILNPSLTVRRLSSELIDIAGFVLPVPADFSPDSIEMAATAPAADFDTRLTAWLLAQGRLELLNGSVIYLDQEEGTPIRITNANVVFEQRLLDWRAVVEGTAHTDETGRDFKLLTAIRKDLFAQKGDPAHWSGEAYLYFAKTDVARLMKKFGFRRIVTSGTASTEMWLDFEKGKITHSTVDLALTDVDLKLDRQLEPLRIQWLGTRLKYKAEYGDIVTRKLAVTDLDFLTDRNEHLGKTNVSLTFKTDAADQALEGTLEASRIDLRPLVSIAHRLPISEKVRQFVNDHPLRGELTDVNIGFSGNPKIPGNWYADSTFKDLSLPIGTDGIPGFSGLSGKITPIQQTGGVKLTLDSSNVQLTFPKVFRREQIRLDHLKSTLELNFNPQPTLHIHALEASNSEASITGAGTWKGTGGPGTLDISGNIVRAKAEAIPYYIPRVLGEGLLDWLEAGILDGDISAGVYQVEGPLATFPWDDANQGKGLFRISADLKRGKLDFLPSHKKNENGHWIIESEYPILRGIDAHLVFQGNSMDIRGKSARSEGLEATDITVRIPSYITDSRLLIDGRIRGDLSNAIGYVNSSHQLSRILANAFEKSSARGKADMHLNIEMPFSAPESIAVNLDLKLADAALQYGYGLPLADKLNGQILITEKSVHTPVPITGETVAGPLNINVATEDGRIDLITQGFVTAKDIENIIGLETAAPFFKKVSGAAPVLVHTAIGLAEPHFSISGTSDMTGLESTLPKPFGKQSAEQWPLSFNWTPNGNGHDLDIHSFGRASVLLRFENLEDKLRWTKGTIALGPQRKMTFGDDIDISLMTPTLDLNAWLPYAADVVDIVNKESRQSKADEYSVIERLGTIRVTTDELTWHENVYPTVEASLHRFNRRDWHLRIGGNQLLSGSATYESATSTHNDVLTVKFGQLHLPLPPEDDPETPQNESAPWTEMPDMSVVVDNLSIGKMNIGKLVAHAQNRRDNAKMLWDIHRLEIFNEGGQISGKGRWTHTPDQDGDTSIDVQINIKDMGKVLSSLNVDNAMTGAPTNASATLSWRGTPFLPELKTLSGSLTSESGSGSFLKIEPGAGRILSLLSMQHLLHRLTLDFRDVLSQGFTFDSLYVTGNFHNGVFSTPKATVFGSAATVLLGGEVDIPRETIDAKAVILPSINAGGPTLALTLVNPAVGIGTFLTQFILQDQLSNIFRAEYDITGSFDEPKLTKIDLKNKSGNRSNAAVQ